ncbi:MAG: HAMP domain-containing histidine kinase [Acidobacteria bacterium]|nr:HAMP domain-containing histidine kinase [Acidobacteriota bacterium]
MAPGRASALDLTHNGLAAMRMSEKQVNVLVGGALLALLPLAWLQYRWISEVSEADQQRRRGELKAAMERIADETDRDATDLHASLIGPIGRDDEPLDRRIMALRPDDESLPVAAVISLFDAGEGDWRAEQWNPEMRGMAQTEVPDWWRKRSFREGPIHAEPPALVGPVQDDRSEGPGWLVVKLDEKKIAEHYFPTLIRHHLGEEFLREYAVRIVARDGSQTLYSSVSGGFPGQPDGTIPLLRRVRRALAEAPPPPPGSTPPPPPPRKKKGRRFGGEGPPPEFGGGGVWRLEIRHTDGSLDTVVARTRMRNLVVSGITVLLLGLAFMALGFAVRRSQRLARLQLEFAAGVSHELRTPLAVIVSAGDNLAGGYVKDPAKVREYGALMRDEGTRLTGMVEQVLRFSAIESEQMPLEKRAVLVSDVMESVEREMKPVGDRQGCVWESRVENATFSGDRGALHVAVRNLVENAMRHGGGKWVGVSGQKSGESVVFTVEDRGTGVPATDLPHLFEPFYRGADSRAQQRKGSGLGLALVNRIAKAHGGKVEVSNKAEGGARFVLTIPCD